MIRINLLPGPKSRHTKSQWDVRAQLLLGVGLLLITLAGCWWYWAALDEEIEAKQAEKQNKEKHLAMLQEQVKQVQDFEAKKKLLEDKNRIIDQLEKSRAGPVRVLDYVSQSIEPLRIWLVRLNVKGNNIEVEGKAMTNDDVVAFVNNLRKTDYFTNIWLQESRSATDNKVSVYQFKVGFSLKG